MKLHDECGIWVHDHKLFAERFTIDYTQRFKSIHGSTRTLPDLRLPQLISYLENNALIKLLNLEEVKISLFNTDSNKTPRSGGFVPGFFENYWHLIKKDFFNYILEFFMNGKILKEINHTFIALILKRNSPSQTESL